MKESFDIILNNYVSEPKKVSNKSKSYISLKKLADEVKTLIDSPSRYVISVSTGIGNKAVIPWLAVMDRNITKSSHMGIYVVYLFCADMSGFYLTIGQGITEFEELYGKNRYLYASKVAQYFQEKINTKEFDYTGIDLRSNEKLARGYEAGTVISKFYQKNAFTDSELKRDLHRVMSEYVELVDRMDNLSYFDIVQNVVNNTVENLMPINEAVKEINQAILEIAGKEEASITTITEIDIPRYRKPVFREAVSSTKKIDYVKKAKRQLENGFIGEQLAITFEKSRLINLGRRDLADRIKWVSTEDDTKGYDIQSFNLDEDNKEYEIYIEVKTVDSRTTDTGFFISQHEVSVLDKNPNTYWLYRVMSRSQELYRVPAKDFHNIFRLDPNTFIATLKP